MTDKQTLRAKCRQKRGRIDAHEANAAAMKLALHLLDAVPASAKVVAVYRPVNGEIDLAGALPELEERGHRLCLPVIKDKQSPLSFHAWGLDQPLVKGPHGIEIPQEGAELVPDAVIVPLLAFDTKGHRLGYGEGYFDRTLRDLRAQKTITAIGAAFASQQVSALPFEPHDEKLDIIVTEKGVIRPA